jgi:flap endonuclease-1
VIVYDSKAPPEKDNERKMRNDARIKSKQRADKIEQIWENVRETTSPSELHNIEMFEEPLASFLTKLVQDEQDLTMYKVDAEILRMKQSLLSIKSEDFEYTKELFTICGVPILIAQGEAEATCAALNVQGYVSAVVTDDTDVLAYGTPIMLTKLDFEAHTCVEIDFQEVLSELKLTRVQFLDLCIMCGTDYNKNIPKIGPDRSMKWIQKYGSIDEIKKHFPNLQYDILNYPRVREIFLTPLTFEHDIPFCDFPEKKQLYEFSFTHNIRFDIEKLLQSCYYSRFHFFDSDEEEETVSEQQNEKKKFLLMNNK